MEKVKFENIRSVKFALDNFAVPVIKPKTKNTIYTERVQNLNAVKGKLTAPVPVNNYGYATSAKWRNYRFAGGANGIFVTDDSLIFVLVTQYFYPTKMFVKNNRMFALDEGGGMVYYSVDLSAGGWNADTVMEDMLYIPNEFGLCLGLSAYKNDLLLICEKALAAVDKNLNLKFLTDDNGAVLANLTPIDGTQMWESAYFALSYATDTQVLREVLLKTNTPITLFAMSNKIEKIVNVSPDGKVQNIKLNVRGDIFKLKIVVPAAGGFAVSNVSAVLSFGKRG